ncbi:MAG: hypothetical protein IIB17_06530 [Chloroflexi bacterium]|nr:hypothetical protein [Chloroflexota bacterium]
MTIENRVAGSEETVVRIENRFDRLETMFEARFARLESQFETRMSSLESRTTMMSVTIMAAVIVGLGMTTAAIMVIGLR